VTELPPVGFFIFFFFCFFMTLSKFHLFLSTQLNRNLYFFFLLLLLFHFKLKISTQNNLVDFRHSQKNCEPHTPFHFTSMLRAAFLRGFRRGRNVTPLRGFAPIAGRHPTLCRSASDAISHIQSNMRVYIHEMAGTPHSLFQALCARAGELHNISIPCVFHCPPNGGQDPLEIDDETHRESFRTEHFFCGPSNRNAFLRDSPHSRFIPIYLHEIPQLITSPDYPIDVALVSLSPPNRHGWCSLGPSVVIARSAVDSAKIIIAEINDKVPRTLGNSFVHYSHLDYVIETSRKLPQFPLGKLTQEHEAIGRHIAPLVPDGACVQAGMGGIPDATLLFLKNHKNLGVHTEMAGDGLISLIKAGVVTGTKKVIHPGKIVTAFVMGTDQMYDEIDDNAGWHFESGAYTNDPYVIAQNPKVAAINSALEIDLSGQICADTIGQRQFSGVGGQVDFVRGAQMSDGGVAIIALPATAKGGKVSRIVPSLAKGASITTARWHGPVVVTEFGCADLWGKNTRQRASALIEIAHPNFREELAKKAAELYGSS
jgi:acyl-CoA hydrolase